MEPDREGGEGVLSLSSSRAARRRQKILKEKAVPMIEGYMFEEHELIRLAATECMCNMAMSKEVRAGPGRLGVCAGLLTPHIPPAPLLLLLLLRRCRSCSWPRAATG